MVNPTKDRKKIEDEDLREVFDGEFFEGKSFGSKKKANNLGVGDIVLFDYPTGKSQHLVMVVKTSKAYTGHYVARGTGNALLTVFKLNEVSPDVLDATMSLLYNKGMVNPSKMHHREKRKFDYFSKMKQGITALFGKKSFRTYIKARIIGDCWVLR